jgi:hypothetical protein
MRTVVLLVLVLATHRGTRGVRGRDVVYATGRRFCQGAELLAIGTWNSKEVDAEPKEVDAELQTAHASSLLRGASSLRLTCTFDCFVNRCT